MLHRATSRYESYSQLEFYEWKPDLSQCVLHVIRQYVKLEATDSGLKGVR